MKKDVRKFMNIIPTPDQTIFKRPENGSYINFTPEMGPYLRTIEGINLG